MATGKPLYLFLNAFKAAAIPLEIIKGFLHQAVQIHLVAELQLWVSLQHYGHHHQQLRTQKGGKRPSETKKRWQQQTHFKPDRWPVKKRSSAWTEICDCVNLMSRRNLYTFTKI